MEALVRDLAFGLKLLRKEKVLTLTVLLTLGVCIGANATIFSVVDAVLLRPLPFHEPERLVRVYNSYPNAGAERASTSAADFFFRRERVAAFEEAAQYDYGRSTVGGSGGAEAVPVVRVTPSLFPLLGVRPRLGRTFAEEEMEPGNELKVLLTHGYWLERFGGDPRAVGTDLRIDGRPHTVVGVLPEDFRFLGQRESRLYLPIAYTAEDRSVASFHNNTFAMIARLRPGATPERAESQIAAMDASLVDRIPIPGARELLEDAGYHAVVRPLRDDLLRDVRPILLMLWAGVGFVLLIGCVNIANLMLARSNVRLRELATRMALGAGRRRLGRQILTEAVLTAVIGGLLGLGVAVAGIRLLETLGVDDLPRGADVGIDGAVLLFTLGLAVAAGILFGAIPVVHVFRENLTSVFRSEGRSGTASRRAVLVRNGLVGGQVALACVLLVGAGLMLASFRELLRVDPGFDTDPVLTGFVSLPDVRYPEADERREFADRLLAGVRALPGVESASVASHVPFGGSASSSVIVPEGYEPRPGESILSPFNTVAGPGYFEAMGIELLRGRSFRESDDAGTTPALVIDRWLAERYWPGEDPVGRRMLRGVPGMEGEEDAHLTIVGVVERVRQTDLASTEHVGAYYRTYRQHPLGTLTLVVRAAVEPGSLIEPVRRVLASLDPELPFILPRTMEERVAETLAGRRSPLILLGIFAAVALFLAVVGIYGMLAYAVTQRRRELGIRMAMGSTGPELSRLVLRRGAKVVGAGLAVGLVGALLLARLLRTLLYGVEPADPVVLGSVVAVLAVAGLAACLLPARRATRVDPVMALTGE